MVWKLYEDQNYSELIMEDILGRWLVENGFNQSFGGLNLSWKEKKTCSFSTIFLIRDNF